MEASGLAEATTCPASCGRSFKTPGAVHSHLRTARSCLWYRSGKLASFSILDRSPDSESTPWSEETPLLSGSGSEGSTLAQEDISYPDTYPTYYVDQPNDFQFIQPETTPVPSNNVGIGEAGPGPSTTAAASARDRKNLKVPSLDDAEDPRYVVEYMTAGAVIRMDKTLHKKWRTTYRDVQTQMYAAADNNGDVDMENPSDEVNPWAPFATKTDCRVANWVIEVSQKMTMCLTTQ